MSKPKSTDFKKNLDDLEKIVEWFESEDVDLEQALENFEKGLKLSSRLKKQLEEVENKVVQLRQDYEDGAESNEK